MAKQANVIIGGINRGIGMYAVYSVVETDTGILHIVLKFTNFK